MGDYEKNSSQSQIKASSTTKGNSNVWTAAQHKAMVAEFNKSLLNDPRTAGKIFAVDSTDIKTRNDVFELIDEIEESVMDAKVEGFKEETLGEVIDLLISTGEATSSANMLDASGTEGYVAIAMSANSAESVNEAMYHFSHAKEQGVDFSNKLSPEFTQTFTLAHELEPIPLTVAANRK